MMNTIQSSYINVVEQEDIVQRNKNVKSRLITRYLDFLSEHKIDVTQSTIREVNHYLATELNHLAPSSYNHRIFILRHFYQWLYENKMINVDWSSHILCKKEPQLLPKNIPAHLMKALCTPTADDLEKLKASSIMKRNQAMIEFLYSTGVRSIELRQAKVKDLSDDLAQCFISTVKSGVPRYVYLGEPAKQALADYLLCRGIVLSSKCLKSAVANQSIFMSHKACAMSYTAVKLVVRKLSIARIGIVVTPHMIRHTFATEMLRATGNIRALQLMLGHRSINSTMCYCHLDLADRKQAIDTYHPMSLETDKFDK